MARLGLDDLQFRISEAAEITGVSARNIRAYIERDLLFRDLRGGRGQNITLRLPEVMQLAAVDALGRCGFSVAVAADIVSQSGAWPFGFQDQLLRAQPNAEGRWQQVVYDPRKEVTIQVNLATSWDRIKYKLRVALSRQLARDEIARSDYEYILDFIDTIATALAWDDVQMLRQVSQSDEWSSDIRQEAAKHADNLQGLWEAYAEGVGVGVHGI